ncbi:MAG: DUF433 domain-containing protein [Candidatus Kapaibacterium sp.]|nr:MAG: DUF433 domain-containing protein [Candidatus Kapabacteria bacterium]
MNPYPHIIRTDGTCGGRPRIDGTRIEVSTIAAYIKQGVTIEELAHYYPSVRPAQILAAAAYFHDNREEIEAFLEERSRMYEEGRALQQERLKVGVAA